MLAKREIKDLRSEGVRLAQLLNPGMKVCLIFPHGMGDVVMFKTVLEKLRKDFPNTLIHLNTRGGMGALDDHDDQMEYDLAVLIRYSCAPATSGMTKNELCCRTELGITPPLNDRPTAPAGYRSPIVAVGCTSISCAGQFTPSAYESRMVNEAILELGFIPVDTAFKVEGLNLHRESPMAVSLRKVPGTYDKLAGLLERSYAFIGTLSGAYHVAQAILPGRNLLLCPRAGEWQRIYRRQPVLINLRDITKEGIKDWLSSLPEK